MTAITRDEVWEMFREVARRFEETDRKIKEVNASIGQLGNRLGEFQEALVGPRCGGLVEGLVKPSVVRLFRERGIPVHEVHRDLSGERDGIATQVDLLVVNDNVCVVVEVKSRLSVDDVNEHEERMGKFKRVFPRYGDIQAHGAVAAMVIPDDVAKYAYRKGFFVIGQSRRVLAGELRLPEKGEAVEILNDGKFQPATW